MQIKKKFVKLGTGSDEISATDISANFASPANYTPATAFITGHLSGIDTKFGTISSTAGDIGHTSFSLANNQAAAANVTALAFANGVTRSAQVHYSVSIDATTDLFECGTMLLIQKSAGWDIVTSSVGDISLVEFSVTSAGQVQYTSGNYTGFSSGKINFRAITTLI